MNTRQPTPSNARVGESAARNMFSRAAQSNLLGRVIAVLMMLGLAVVLSRCGGSAETSAPTTTTTQPGLARPAQTTTGTREPMPVGNIPGWRQVFTDDFSGGAVDDGKWHLYGGMPGGDPAGWFDPRHVTVSNGTLVISAYRDQHDGGRWATGGLSSSVGLVQTYGKYLVRFRLDQGVGVAFAALLWPADNSWPPEIDFAEGNGNGPFATFATLHYGKQNTHWAAGLPDVNLTQWHTLGVEWTPGKLQYTIDGRIWKTMESNAVPAIPMVLDLQTQTWPCGSWARCPDASTPDVVRMYVDWVVAYAPDGNAS